MEDPIPRPASAAFDSTGRRSRRRSTLTVNGIPLPTYPVIMVCLIFGLYKTAVNGVLTFGPIVVSHFDRNDAHVGIYVMTAFWTGNALAVMPASALFINLGRKNGFFVGLCAIGLGLLVCIMGTVTENYLFLIAGIAVFGAGNAILAFLRYAAAEVCKQNAISKGTSVTYVLSAGILSAVLGPSISSICFKVVKNQQFLAAFMVMIVLVFIGALVLSKVEFPPLVAPEEEEEEYIRQSEMRTGGTSISTRRPRRFKRIIQSSSFVMATCLAFVSTVGMDIFTSSMGIAMYNEFGIPLSQVSIVFLVHFVGMTAPGMFSGATILRCGVYMGCIVGCLLKVCAIAIFFTEKNFPGFIVGAAFLGVGWNFTYSCAALLVLGSTRKSEVHKKPSVQSAMDFWVFMGSAVITVLTASIYEQYKWRGVSILGSVFIGLYAGGIILIYVADLEAEMHFENLMDEEDERREKEAEMRRVEELERGDTVNVSVSNPMQQHGQPASPSQLAYSLDYSRQAQDRARRKGNQDDARTPNRSRADSADSTEDEEYESTTPDASSLTTEYIRAGSGRFRVSVVAEALALEGEGEGERSRTQGQGQDNSQTEAKAGDVGPGENEDRGSEARTDAPEAAVRPGSRSSGGSGRRRSTESLEEIRLSVTEAATAL